MTKFLPLIVLVAAGCATAPPPPALVRPTSSGLAEGTFHGTTIAEVQSRFAAACTRQGRTVDNINSMQISCFHDQLGLRAETWRYTTTWTMVQAGLGRSRQRGSADRVSRRTDVIHARRQRRHQSDAGYVGQARGGLRIFSGRRRYRVADAL